MVWMLNVCMYAYERIRMRACDMFWSEKVVVYLMFEVLLIRQYVKSCLSGIIPLFFVKKNNAV
jgi:hypothetical protein